MARLLRTAVFALIPAAALLVGAEAALRVLGVGDPRLAEDPFAGFEPDLYPAFLQDPFDPARIMNNPARREIRHGSWLRRSPPGTLRVLAVGESNVQIFENERLEEALSRALGGRPVEALNSGASSFGSHRIALLARDWLAAFDVDLVLLYMGHNEFLERLFFRRMLAEPPRLRAARKLLARTHLYTAMRAGLRALRKATVGLAGEREFPPPRPDLAASPEDPELEKAASVQGGAPLVYERFRFNLERIAALAEAEGAPVIVATPARHYFYAPTQPCGAALPANADYLRHRDAIERARAATAEGRPEEALAALEAEDARAGPDAATRWERARALEAAGRMEEGAAERRRALETDCAPVAAGERVRAILKDFAAARGYPLIDFAAELEARAPRGLTGDEALTDYCHLNEEARRLLFARFAEEAAALQRAGKLRRFR